MFIRVPPASDLPVAEALFSVRANGLKFGNAVNCVDRQTEAVGFVVDRQFHRRIDVPFFLVAAHMQVLVIGTPVGQSVGEPRISVEIEDDRLVRGEQ